MNLSGSLLVWTLGHLPAEFYTKLDNTYIGNRDWEGTDNWGDYYYVRTKTDYSKSLLKELRDHKMYIDYYCDDDGNTIIVFRFSNEQKEKIVQPFIEGKYSEIDRDYVKKYFRRTTSSGRISTNWQILNKAKELWKHWMQELNVTPYIRINIPEDAEVWSKIKKELEILNFTEDLQHQEESSESK